MFVGSNAKSHSRIPLINTIRRKVVWNALLWLKENNPTYHNIEINSHYLNGLDEVEVFSGETIEDKSLQEFLNDIQDHNNEAGYDEMTFEFEEPVIYDKLNDDSLTIDHLDMQTNGIMTLPLANMGLDEIKLRASLNTWMNLVRKGPLLASLHESTINDNFRDLHWFPSMYPILFPYGITGPDSQYRSRSIQLHEYAKHMISISDKRFQTHDTFMFALYNIIQMRNVSKAMRFKIMGKNTYNIEKGDLQDAIQSLVNNEVILNTNVQKLLQMV